MTRKCPVRFGGEMTRDPDMGARFLPNLHKGSYVYIEGPLSQNEYTNREGQVRQSLEVRVREMRMLDKAGDNAGASQDGSQGARQTTPAPVADVDTLGSPDDIPF
jgi:single-stranded DNA-binding protein